MEPHPRQPCPSLGRARWYGAFVQWEGTLGLKIGKNYHFFSCQHSREMISIFCGCSRQEKNGQPPAPCMRGLKRRRREAGAGRGGEVSSGGTGIMQETSFPTWALQPSSSPAPTDHRPMSGHLWNYLITSLLLTEHLLCTTHYAGHQESFPWSQE